MSVGRAPDGPFRVSRCADRFRPLLGRKLHHKSAEELRVLGLAVDEPDGP